MASDMIMTCGWDVGGAHVKAAKVARWSGGEAVTTAMQPFEVWRARDELVAVLRQVAAGLGVREGWPMAATMTAELADTFRTKREGVLFVLGALREAFPRSAIRVLSIAGEFVSLPAARLRPLDFAATNWVAAALFTATRQADCILIDVGSTTTDIIPIRGGRIACEGRTDLARMTAGELVYTGVVRTNPNTLTSSVPVKGSSCGVAAESFAVMGDAYLLLDRIATAEYTCPTPDGREVSRDGSRERLARLVCADVEMLGDEEIIKVARYLVERQVEKVSAAVLQVLSRLDDAYSLPVAAAGAGAFLAADVGRRLGLSVLESSRLWGGAAVALPAAAAAWLLAVGGRPERLIRP